MAYEGQSGQHFINFNALSFSTVEVVVVSGSGPNFCGHSLLRVDGYYFHISGMYNYPKFMSLVQFERYRKVNDKTVFFTTRRHLKNKTSAKQKLKALLKEKWLWLIVPNNCLGFVEDIVAAGEDDLALITNCPTLLQAKIMISTGEWRKGLIDEKY